LEQLIRDDITYSLASLTKTIGITAVIQAF
jgi:hypothetical protein